MKETWNALMRFCSYQERCKSDVLKKMKQLNVPEVEFDKWIEKLTAENFLNERRFVKSFVNGRFKNKGWGAAKIKIELLARKVDASLAEQVIQEEIGEFDYKQKITQIAEKKWKFVKGENNAQRGLKLQKFLMQKGFEFQTIKEVMQSDIFR